MMFVDHFLYQKIGNNNISPWVWLLPLQADKLTRLFFAIVIVLKWDRQNFEFLS